MHFKVERSRVGLHLRLLDLGLKRIWLELKVRHERLELILIVDHIFMLVLLFIILIYSQLLACIETLRLLVVFAHNLC